MITINNNCSAFHFGSNPQARAKSRDHMTSHGPVQSPGLPTAKANPDTIRLQNCIRIYFLDVLRTVPRYFESNRPPLAIIILLQASAGSVEQNMFISRSLLMAFIVEANLFTLHNFLWKSCKVATTFTSIKLHGDWNR